MALLNLEMIRRRRKLLKVTQEEMAASLGLKSGAAYSHYESGKGSFKADHLPKICEALECRLNDLFVGGLTVGMTLGEKLEVAKELNAIMQNIEKGENT